MKIVHLNTQGHGVGDYRHWMPARALARRGHEVWWHDGDGVWGCRSDAELEQFLAEKAAWADVLHMGFCTNLQMIRLAVTARNYAAKVFGKALPLLVDCDDDVMHVPTYNTAFRAYHATAEAKRLALWHFKNSDAMSVTMPALQPLYSDFTKDVALLPNCIEPEQWDGLPVDPRRKDSDDIRIVFAGGIGRKGDLDEIRDALEIVMRARPQVRLIFMGMMPDWAAQWMPSASDPAKNRAFYIGDADTPVYRRTMRWIGADIAVAPVVQSRFNSSKSEIKIMEAAMFGAASVCTDWDTYAAVPKDACLKADTTYEWKESLLALIDDPELRRRKAAAARQWTLDERHIDTKISLWEDFYDRALSRPVIGDNAENMVAGTEALAVTEQRAQSPALVT